MLVRLGLAAAFLGAVATLYVSAADFGRVSSLANSMACYRGLYFGDALDEARAVFVGSSRIRRGLDPDAFAAAEGWPEAAVANLGHPKSSAAFDAALARELAGRAPLELIVIEVSPRSPEQVEREHRAARERRAAADLPLSSGVAEELFYVGASWGEMAAQVWRAAETPALGLWDLLRAGAARIERQLVYAARMRNVRQVFAADPAIDGAHGGWCMRRDWLGDEPRGELQEELITRYRDAFGPDEAGRRWTDPAPGRYLTAPELGLARAALADLAAFGRARGIAVVGIYLPGVATPQPDPAFVDEVEAALGLPVLIPDEALRARLEDEFYDDNVHLNASGRRLLTAWLAERLRALPAEGGS
ncbi:MAG: hypothetical protein AAGF90_03215 [Pseudomonadota bacterium]